MDLLQKLRPCLGTSTVEETIKRAREDKRVLEVALKDFYNGVGANMLLGLSGGIDSAVIAALGFEALGPERMRFIVLPGPYSSSDTQNDAMAMGKALGVDTKMFSIKESYEAVLAGFEASGEPIASIAKENLQARLRMVHLMAVSNSGNYIVCNTGNKSEAAMGFCTMYGDAIGAFSPLGDMYKTRVYALAEVLNEERELIPRSIIERAPSAELSAGQKDCDSLLPYDLLDEILYAHIECGMDEKELVASGFAASDVAEALQRLRQNAFKRQNKIPTPKMSTRTLAEYDAQ